MHCGEHNKELVSKCVTCDVFICVKCLNSMKHDGHDRITIEEVVEMKKLSIENEINDVVVMIANECDIINGYKKIEREIHDAMEALHNELMCEEKRLQNYLDQYTKESSDRLECRYNQLDHLTSLKSKFNNTGNGRSSLMPFDKDRILNYWYIDKNNSNDNNNYQINNNNLAVENNNGIEDPIRKFIQQVAMETNYENDIGNPDNIEMEELLIKPLESLKVPITSPVNIIYKTIDNINIQFRDYIKGLHTMEFEEESKYFIKQHRLNQILQSCDVTTDQKWLLLIKSISIDNIVHYCKNKHASLDTFKYLLGRELGIGKNGLDELNLLKVAATKGNLDILKFLIDYGIPLSPFIMDEASINGHLSILKYLNEHRTEGCTTKAMDLASDNGHIEIVKYLNEHRTEGCTTNAMDEASINGHLSVVKYLDEHRTEGCTINAMDLASKYGHLEVVKYLNEHRTEGCTTRAMDGASYNGNLDVVKYLNEHRTEGCTTNAMDGASYNGHLHVVKYLNEHRAEGFTTKAMDCASINGHLSVVKYLNEHRTEGCTTRAMDRASEDGHLDVVKYLNEHRTEGCTTKAMDGASYNGNLEIIKYLNEHRTEGCTTNAIDWASKNGHLDVVKYLNEHRTEGCTFDAMRLASRNGHLSVVKYLNEHRTEGCSLLAMIWASTNGHLEIVKYLDEQLEKELRSTTCI